MTDPKDLHSGPADDAAVALDKQKRTSFNEDADLAHEDERSPLEHEDDHSTAEFNLDAEIESKLGPAEADPLAASREAGQAYLRLTQAWEPQLDPAARAAAARNVDGLGVEDDSRPHSDTVTGEPSEHEHDADDDDGGCGLVMSRNAEPEAPASGQDGEKPGDGAENGLMAVADAVPPVSAGQGGSPAVPDADAEDDEEEDDDDDEEEEEEDDQPMTLRDHLRELRKRLLYAFLICLGGFFVCWPFAETLIFPFLFQPLVDVMPADSKLIFTSPPEAFFTYLKISFVSGIFLTCPLVFYQLWAFIAPGLYKEEKLYILPVAVFSAIFFLCGGAFCYFVVFDFVFTFFMSYNQGVIQAMPKLNESLSFVLQLLLAFGLVFELPLFIFFLARLGIVTAQKLRNFRRYAVLLSVIIGAVLTPPDVISQLLMAGPLLILYELSIYIAAVFGKKKDEPKKEEEEDEEDDDDEEETEKTAPGAA